MLINNISLLNDFVHIFRGKLDDNVMMAKHFIQFCFPFASMNFSCCHSKELQSIVVRLDVCVYILQ